MKNSTLKLLVLGGIAGPVVFTITVLICSSLRTNNNGLHQFISELGATGTSNALVMNYAGFVPTGILITLFGISLFMLFKGSIVTRIGSVLLTVFGIGIFLSGLFSCDQGCPNSGTFESNIHQTIAPITFISAIVGMFLMGVSFRRFAQWRKLKIYSLLSAIISFALMLALISSLESRSLTGLWQRLLLLVLFTWTAVISFNIYKIDNYGKG